MALPRPDGLELYLDVRDISGTGWLDRMQLTVDAHCPREGFDFVVEGPLRSLDGSFFDLSEDSESNREVVRRVVDAARALAARAAVLHLIAPRPGSEPSDRDSRRRALERAVSLSELYADLCRSAGVVPTLENVPPVARMRESQYLQSLIGMEPDDLLFIIERVPDIRVTLDVSHAQLYLNCLDADREVGQLEELPADMRGALGNLRLSPTVRTLADYMAILERYVESMHLSNARGVLGEGLPYDDGVIDLDFVVERMARSARFLVTETIEPDSDRARFMRYAQARMMKVLDRPSMGVKS